MDKIYVCSPYRGDTKKNTENAKRYSWIEALHGAIPITPHLYFTTFLDDDNICDRSQGLRMGKALLLECKEVHVYADEVSEGMIEEIKLAQKHEIPVKFYNSDMEEIKYESLIINKRIGPGYRQIIEDAFNPGRGSRICPYAGSCNGSCEQEGNKDNTAESGKRSIIIRRITRS